MTSKIYDLPDRTSTIWYYYTQILGTPPPADWSEELVVRRHLGTYIGAQTPHFMKQKREGRLLPLNAYTRYDYEETRNPGTYDGTYRYPKTGTATRIYSFKGNPPRGLNGTSDSLAVARSNVSDMLDGFDPTALSQAAFANIAPDLDALTTLVEAPKTLAMILGARRNAERLIRQASAGGFRTARAVSRAWLEWRYGWRILGYDIQNAVDAYNYPFRDNILEGRARDQRSEMRTYTQTDDNYYVSYTKVTDVSRSLQINALARARYSGRSLNVLASPVNTLWEVIPFSFVADWFVSVGDALKAWTVLARSEEVAASWGYDFSESATMSLTDVKLGVGAYASTPFGASSSSSSECSLKARIPLGAPTLLPQIRLRMTGKNVLDAIALLSGGFSPHLRR